jgi:hypothetical protein
VSGIWVRLLARVLKIEHVDLDNKPVFDIIVKVDSPGV